MNNNPPCHLHASLLAVSVSIINENLSELSRSYTPSSQPYFAGMQQFRDSQGHVSVIKSTRGNDNLPARLKQIEELMTKDPPVAIYWNAYPQHHSIQVALRSAMVIAFMFDSCSGDLARVHTDDSTLHYVKNTCSSAIISSDKLLVCLSDRIVAIVNSQRDKCKRPYFSPKNCVVAGAPFSARVTTNISFNSNSEFICAAGPQHIAIFKWQHHTAPLLKPTLDSKEAESKGFLLRRDTSLELSPAGELKLGNCFVHYCKFDQDLRRPNELIVLYVEEQQAILRRDKWSAPARGSTGGSLFETLSTLSLGGSKVKSERVVTTAAVDASQRYMVTSFCQPFPAHSRTPHTPGGRPHRRNTCACPIASQKSRNTPTPSFCP
jgi:hypothetical protein